MEPKHSRRSKSFCVNAGERRHNNNGSTYLGDHSNRKYGNSNTGAKEYCCEFKRISKPEFSSSFFSMDDWDPSYINHGGCEYSAQLDSEEPKRISRVKFANPLIRRHVSLSKLNSKQNIEETTKSSGDNVTNVNQISGEKSGTDNFSSKRDVSKNRVNQYFLDINKCVRKPRDSLSNLSEVQKNFEKVMLKKVKRYMPEMGSQEIQEKLLRSKKPPEFYLKPEDIVEPVLEELKSYQTNGGDSAISNTKKDSIRSNGKITTKSRCSDYNEQNFSTGQLKNGTFDDDIAEMDKKMTWILNASSKVLKSLEWKYE